ncbi:MAG: hypothetical protein AAF514_18515 [Verrucomicrobiota bacterium]
MNVRLLTAALLLSLVCLAATAYRLHRSEVASAEREWELVARNRALSDRLYFSETEQRRNNQLSRFEPNEVTLPKPIPLLADQKSIEQAISNGEPVISFPYLILITPPLPAGSTPTVD